MTPVDVHMRDSQDVQRVLTFPAADWVDFVSRVREPRATGAEGPICVFPASARVVVSHRSGGGELSFARPDWEVFIAGVQAGEFSA